MRWGVRDEATDDHMTTELCMKEIENCQRLSMGPNFVVSKKTINKITPLYHMILGFSGTKIRLQTYSHIHHFVRIAIDQR